MYTKFRNKQEEISVSRLSEELEVGMVEGSDYAWVGGWKGDGFQLETPVRERSQSWSVPLSSRDGGFTGRPSVMVHEAEPCTSGLSAGVSFPTLAHPPPSTRALPLTCYPD